MGIFSTHEAMLSMGETINIDWSTKAADNACEIAR